MRRTLIWLLLCSGCVFGCCTGAAPAEPSGGSETGSLSEAGRYQAYADNVIALDRLDQASLTVSVYSYLDSERFQKLVDASVEARALHPIPLREKVCGRPETHSHSGDV